MKVSVTGFVLPHEKINVVECNQTRYTKYHNARYYVPEVNELYSRYLSDKRLLDDYDFNASVIVLANQTLLWDILREATYTVTHAAFVNSMCNTDIIMESWATILSAETMYVDTYTKNTSVNIIDRGCLMCDGFEKLISLMNIVYGMTR